MALGPWAVTCKQALLLQLGGDEGTVSKAGKEEPLANNWECLVALDWNTTGEPGVSLRLSAIASSAEGSWRWVCGELEKAG